MRHSLHRFIRFLSELNRRRVVRVAVMYGTAAVGVLAAANDVAAVLELANWVPRLVIFVTLMGFPVALALAWAYDLTPDGIKRAEPEQTPPLADGPSKGLPPKRALSAQADQETNGNFCKTRLIVLPFRVLRPDPETDFLAFSLPDAITSALSGLQSLIVRSSLAAQRLAAETLDLKSVALEANVDVVLTGTLLHMGDKVRVRTQLTEAQDGTLLWTQTSDIALSDLFQLQDQITNRIVESLDLPLTAREHGILRHDVPTNARAYEFFLRANQTAHVVGGWSTARDLYLQSLEEDPQYAPAWAQLGRCYRLIAKWESTGREANSANLRLAEAAFERALAINPDLPVAHNLYAALEVELGRAQDAMVRLLARAQLSGGDPQIFAGLVHTCRFCGLLEASLAAHRRARQLDPAATTSVAHTYYMLGDYESVLAETFADIGYIAPLALASMARTEEAINLLREREHGTGDHSVRHYLASLRALLEGKPEESLRFSEEATANLRDPEALHYQVRQLAFLGIAERAATEFRGVVDAGFFCFPFFARDSWLQSLRDRHDFQNALNLAEARHHEASQAFREAGGEFLLQTRIPHNKSAARSTM